MNHVDLRIFRESSMNISDEQLWTYETMHELVSQVIGILAMKMRKRREQGQSTDDLMAEMQQLHQHRRTIAVNDDVGVSAAIDSAKARIAALSVINF